MDSSCLNPTQVGAGNTTGCESLPSKLANFTEQFFGTVVKSDVAGGVTWTLPCGLETGLPANPRGYGEGVACYFLRVFYDSIRALKGPTGDAGADGAAGGNAISFVTTGFSQPAVGGTVAILVQPTPALLVGCYLFIQESGWYQVVSVAGDSLVVTLLVSAPGAGVLVAAGAVIVPVSPTGTPITGLPGLSGAAGARGVQGPDGVKGTDANKGVNGMITGVGLADMQAHISGAQPIPVVFSGVTMDIPIPAGGNFYIVGTTQTTLRTSAVLFLAEVSYLVRVISTDAIVGTYTNSADANAALEAGQYVDEVPFEVLDQTWQATPYEPRLLQAFFHPITSRTIRLWVNQDTSATAWVKASATTLSWIQIA
jgi:hypothetical protein